LLVHLFFLDDVEKLLGVDTAALGTGVLFLPGLMGGAAEVKQGL
jgi:hypothetical protein